MRPRSNASIFPTVLNHRETNNKAKYKSVECFHSVVIINWEVCQYQEESRLQISDKDGGVWEAWQAHAWPCWAEGRVSNRNKHIQLLDSWFLSPQNAVKGGMYLMILVKGKGKRKSHAGQKASALC